MPLPLSLRLRGLGRCPAAGTAAFAAIPAGAPAGGGCAQAAARSRWPCRRICVFFGGGGGGGDNGFVAAAARYSHWLRARRQWRSYAARVGERRSGGAANRNSAAPGALRASAGGGARENRVVFLGTPEVARIVLAELAAAAARPGAPFTLAGVVTQPPARTGRRMRLTPSPVHAFAERELAPRGVPIWTPERIRDDDAFLAEMRERVAPALCVTAAFGQLLPQSFLDIPLHGTLNIHPSLLPAYRGAAPVQRAIQDGVRETGVSIARTVLAMDAGPIVAQERVALDGDGGEFENMQAPELQERLFRQGARMLVEQVLPSVFACAATIAGAGGGGGGGDRDGGEAAAAKVLRGREQNHAEATRARKLSRDEARLTFCENAVIVHNKVRAFAGWPGTWVDVVITSASSPATTTTTDRRKSDTAPHYYRHHDDEEEKAAHNERASSGRAPDAHPQPQPVEQRIKVLSTRVARRSGGAALGVHQVSFVDDGDGGALRFTCDDGSQVDVLAVQPAGKAAMRARAFWNGLRGRHLARKRVPH